MSFMLLKNTHVTCAVIRFSLFFLSGIWIFHVSSP